MVILLCFCLFSKNVSIPTPTPKPASFELQQHQAVSKLNLTDQEFKELSSKFSHILSDPIKQFSKNLLRTLAERRENDNKNMIVSPLSIHIAMSMLYFGSPKNSTTNEELANVLNLSNESDKSDNYLFNYLYLLKFYNDARRIYDAEVEIANKIFLQDGFLPKRHFKTILEAFYLTSTQNTNFEDSEEAANVINDYVNKKTRGLIEEIISSRDVGALTRLVLVNAIYFKANWKYQFNKRFTAPMSYNLLDDQGTVTHEKGMKVLATLRSSTSETLGARILELPYESNDFNMYVMIPKNNTLESLNELAANYDIEDIQASLRSSPENQKLRVYMPAFETTFKTGLKETLETMGIGTLFNNAELDDISDEPLYVSDALHKAQVKVNEEGSEAAAATAVIVNTRSGGPSFRQYPEFRVDQPFVFVIYDNANNLPLFLGRIINPSGETNDKQVEETTSKVHVNESNIEQREDLLQKLTSQLVHVVEHSSTSANGTEINCNDGKQHNMTLSKEAVIFPCKGRDTDAVEKAEKLKRKEESEKLKRFEELRNARAARFH
jgi:serpin B